MEFKYNKELVVKETGKVITMKALVTIHKQQFVDCNENENRYPATELEEVK